MRPFTTALLTLGVLAGMHPDAVAAQRPFRSGFWVENGVGTGTIRIGCSTCAEPTVVYGQSSYLRGGASLSSRVLLGIEVFALLDERFGLAEGDSSLTIENVIVGPVVLWYPWRGGLFLKGGFGLAHGEVLIREAGANAAPLATGTGSGVMFGAGFDVPIFKWLSVTANFGIYYTALGDVRVQGTYIDDVITSMYNANFAITIR
jgi:hypothetical protein